MSTEDAPCPVEESLTLDPASKPLSSVTLPPSPPPLPIKPTVQQNTDCQRRIKLKSDTSPFIKKLQAAQAVYWYGSEVPPPLVDIWAAPIGYYFVYGTLMDPALLAEILSLDWLPRLRPAKIVGYSLKLWGQYPALVSGHPGKVLNGMAFEVTGQQHAERLAEYETRAYRTRACKIEFTDGLVEETVTGYCFQYNGNPMDLDDGVFDLGVWLKRMGRTKGVPGKTT